MGKTKTEKIDAKKSKAATPTTETVYAVMQQLAKNGIKEFSSRQLSDKLGLEPDAGRQKVRTLMKKLEKAGKVVIEQKAVKEKGARKRYFYRLKVIE